MHDARRIDLPDADVTLHTGIAWPSSPGALLAELLADIPWRQDNVRLFGREIPQPRLTAWYGEPGARYRYSGLSLDPMPWTSRLASLRDDVSRIADAPFDSCLLTLYRDGRDAIGAHADDEAQLGPEPVIAALSLGAERPLVFRPKRPGPGIPDRVSMPMPAGSLVVMRGATQANWTHAIPRSSRPIGARISLTFRRVR